VYHFPQSLNNLPFLKSTELILLKSLALGLGCETIQNLLEISSSEFHKRLESIFTKLQVCNTYAAVKKAFRIQLLNEKEFVSEKIKSNSLVFATRHYDCLKKISSDSNKGLWDFYELLLDFFQYIDEQRFNEESSAL
jgi:DNA-binding CsgD family transcriptional regulator